MGPIVGEHEFSSWTSHEQSTIWQGEFDAITCLDPGRIVVHDPCSHAEALVNYVCF